MSVTKRGDSYQADIKIKGHPRVRQSFLTQSEAMLFEATYREAIRLGKATPGIATALGRPRSVVDLSSLIEAVTVDRWSDRGDARDAWMFAEFAGKNMVVVDALAADMLTAYVVSLREAGKSTRTINRRLSACSALLRGAKARNLVPASLEIPWQQARSVGRLRFYDDNEIAQINRTLVALDFHDYAHLVTFLVDTGCRLGELEKLRWADIDRGRVSFLGTKNGTDRTIPLTNAAKEAIVSMRGRYGDTHNGPFKWMVRHKFRTVWDKVRSSLTWMDSQCVVHTFRHTCASRLMIRGHSTGLIMKWMGHKTVAMTMRYSHLRVDGLDSLAASLDNEGQKKRYLTRVTGYSTM